MHTTCTFFNCTIEIPPKFPQKNTKDMTRPQDYLHSAVITNVSKEDLWYLFIDFFCFTAQLLMVLQLLFLTIRLTVCSQLSISYLCTCSWVYFLCSPCAPLNSAFPPLSSPYLSSISSLCPIPQPLVTHPPPSFILFGYQTVISSLYLYISLSLHPPPIKMCES